MQLLDVGTTEYGDAVLCKIGGRTILIDAGHPHDYKARPGFTPIQDQLKNFLGTPLRSRST